MKTEELQQIGLDEDQIKKVFAMNGRDIEEAKRSTAKVEAERDEWKKRAEAAEETLAGFDGVDVEKMRADIASWKQKAEEAELTYKKGLEERDFAEALRTELESVQFTSEAAKKAITEEIKKAGLRLRDGKILGLTDLIDQIRERDASAFVTEGTAKFTTPPAATGKTVKGFSQMTLAEKMRYANENPDSAEVRDWLNQ